ncbi:RNA polymerase sigma factor [Sphingobacterium spiritivorum]|uniref:RNA polymerase sigma factor n=1 Tax=Sphingobacterium spiritivorum TaxID=258 RepID=UPI001917BBA4|nr:RNA polymerase sigma-70 factor [Sphingobacterium spiritivorum]QQT25318.1 RNA polymerase sigma-70 factor [Sphingobacterium spiritivorum]
MYPLQHEEEFVKHLSEGSQNAYELLFSRYWTHVFAVVKLLVKSQEQAEDISQEIFVKVWNRREDLGEVKNIKAYLYTIARNTTLDHLRKKVLVTENLEQMIHYFTDHALTPVQRMEYKELENIISRGIATLPSKVKEVFVMSRIDGLSHEEIAARLDISVTSSKTYVVRALKLLRHYMSKNTDLQVLVLGALLLEKIISQTK